ncbi:quinone oxidoreductase [Bacillus sp. B15-48]|uniref:quinone oxidoreductase family protein n=1 Tax=Bacillus sp. B15-48 TaxID=1548601 RepID=UPI00193FF34C|nr:quinone oxidoreductase [Bacillus sp. B15-48]MBM4765037.1 zinc-binding dehydrogenase [Bacillus sp. B15-48]
MKAVLVRRNGGPEVLHLENVLDPVPNPNQVVIRSMTTSVNYIDVMSRQGLSGYKREVPFIPGREVAGIIEKVGAKVKGLQVGQRVMALASSGSYAEKVVADAEKTFLLPDSIDFETAAGILLTGITAYNIVVDVAAVKEGDSVLIHAAAGGVGTIAAQLAKLRGASTVIGTVGSNEKVEVAKRYGVDKVINHREENFAGNINEWTDGKGVDVILDSISGPTLELGLTCLANRGRLVVFSHAGGEVGNIKTTQLNASGRSIHGFSMKNLTIEELRLTVQHLLELLEVGKLKVNIGKKFYLSEIESAHQWVESPNNVGKTIIKVVN